MSDLATATRYAMHAITGNQHDFDHLGYSEPVVSVCNDPAWLFQEAIKAGTCCHEKEIPVVIDSRDQTTINAVVIDCDTIRYGGSFFKRVPVDPCPTCKWCERKGMCIYAPAKDESTLKEDTQ